ncbi:hypothetical protein M2475_002152 [Breznakia sp. PF5-3]|uniref:hypothetical protein n=1 Tax=unclassified Breznakia TaxID=2623764 RepID=UPI002404BD81|nr:MULTISPECIES: hypothetical protein [unclassified Breznakia]MDF9825766.1 hypothetical protein [Breznakia sp. PM6-1]MDF9836571.1 hypothetical protein [Breznakia sp. PF5-3]MDF9838822.1 hypothetical protein [Breznakia sp. PFB2-8]MDF9860844.1 hypothetical protein [Breznakia sp. PH5-24]
MNEYKEAMLKIKLSDNDKYILFDQIVNHKQKKNSFKVVKRVAFTLLIIGCMVSILNPNILAEAKEAVKQFFFGPTDQNGEILNSDRASYTDISDDFPKEFNEYATMEKLETALHQSYLKPKLPLSSILYKPFVENNIILSYSLTFTSTNGHKIDLVKMFENELTAEQIKLIQSPDHPETTSNINFHITGYSNASNVSGENINAMGDAIRIEEYTSSTLNTKIIIYKLKQMDGTYVTYANFTKDNLIYSLSGYVDSNELKQIIETMYY